ncbi:mitochondrial carrier family [Rhizoctonia solani]|uniref:Mitochondrial carrier family n=1 Tax=Rhizoctonia solani TaxID=456999 RepID=A0A8H7IHW3_9AGAM|nr:mitochondrial carrier family [Rhizoctonia solani]
MAPPTQPAGSKSIAQILTDARSRLDRISGRSPAEALGEIPGALIIERNVLEWRLDPQSDAHLKNVAGVGTYEVEPIIFCQEGYTSSLAAASLKDLGLSKATDLNGGFKAWKEAGLPTAGGVFSGTPQDLVDWLAPTLSASHFREPPDIVAVGFQELLPLHLGLTGLSKGVVASRDELLRSQIEKHNSSSGEHVAYTLVAKAVNVGVALLIYARDHGVGQRICDVQTAWTGVWACMGEIMTFVCAHLTAHVHNMKSRLRDWEHMVKTLLFANTSRESQKRLPAWTDRILYTTYLDSPATPEASYIIPMLYTTVPSYTTSDHKPVVALLRVPSAAASSLTPMLRHYGNLPFQPAYYPALIKKYVGKLLGWVLGWFWCALWFIGAGHAGVGWVTLLLARVQLRGGNRAAQGHLTRRISHSPRTSKFRQLIGQTSRIVPNDVNSEASSPRDPDVKRTLPRLAATQSEHFLVIFSRYSQHVYSVGNKTVVCATSASLLSTLAGYPLDSLKSRLQASRTPISVPRLAQLVWREEGLAGFFRGIWIPLMTISAVRAASFTIYTNSKNYLHDVQGLSRSKWSHVALSGATAGAVSGSLISFCGAPFELVKIRRQLEYSIAAEKGIAVDKPPGNIDAIKDIFRQHGTLGLYKGFKLHFCPRYGWNCAVLYGIRCYEAFIGASSQWPSRFDSNMVPPPPLHDTLFLRVYCWSHVMGDHISIRCCENQDSAASACRYTSRGVFETFKRMLRGSDPNSPKPLLVGLTRLYQGLGVSAFRSILTHGMLWTFFDWVGNFIDDL